MKDSWGMLSEEIMGGVYGVDTCRKCRCESRRDKGRRGDLKNGCSMFKLERNKDVVKKLVKD